MNQGLCNCNSIIGSYMVSYTQYNIAERAENANRQPGNYITFDSRKNNLYNFTKQFLCPKCLEVFELNHHFIKQTSNYYNVQQVIR